MEQILLARLKAEQQQYALQALQFPNLRTEFEYGQRSGVIAGLEKAIEVLIGLVKEERDDDKDL